MLSEADEIQLAGELLEVTNEAELDRFLGDFIKKVGSVAGQVIRSPVGQAVGGVLKGVAKKALPMAGGAIGGYFGGPLGAKIGSGLASAAGSALGLESEQLEQEDREFEGAKQFVSVAADTVKAAASAPPGSDPRRSGPGGGRAAARKFAPALLGQGGGVRRRGRRAWRERPLAAPRQQDRALRRVRRHGDRSLRTIDLAAHEARALLARLALVRSVRAGGADAARGQPAAGHAGRDRPLPGRRQTRAPQGRA